MGLNVAAIPIVRISGGKKHMGFYATRTKGITAFLILAMLLSLFSSQTMVANATESEDGSSFLLASDIPEAISSDVILSSNHISRMFEEEADLNTVVFSNADDTATMYYFAEPIKYVTDAGVVKDKSNKLYSTFDVVGYAEKYAYANLDNDIRTFFPHILSSSTGVLLSTADIEIELLPITDNASDVEIISDSNRAVRYNNTFGDGTTLRYSALFSGFKEDIILDNNVGNVYQFLLKPNGLQALMNENAIYLVEPDTQMEVAYINPVYVYDSFTGDVDEEQVHSTYNNTIDLVPKDNGDYEITITVDNEFLNNADTVYPVYVDPTITINTTGSGSSKTIQDAPIYNGSGAQGIASGSNTTAVIGYVGTQSSVQYGAGRLLMKFPGLRSNTTFLKLNADTISAATLYLRELSGQSSSATIGAYLYTGTAWTETSATYNNTTWNGYSTLLGTASVGSSSATTVSFNIKGAMAGWISSATTADKGIMLKNNTSESSLTYYKSFYSTEGTTKPYVSVTYTWYGCKPYRSVTSSSINCQGMLFT
jgi:hypothetical protein